MLQSISGRQSRPGWGRISDVDLENPATWENRCFLTFDMDWAHDEVMYDTLSILSRTDIPTTWFVTHKSPILSELRADPNIELGIHPNFNKLLLGDSSNGRTVNEVIFRLLEIVPEAKAVRAHSLLQSSRILDSYAEAGLTHDATHFVDPFAATSLRPWRHWNGLVRVPPTWGDDVACMKCPEPPILDASCADRADEIISQPLFHPIHVFLNTEDLGRYERTRTLHHDPRRLERERHFGVGVRTLLLNLIEEHQS